MKEILRQWCETGKLSVEQAMMCISEYLSYTERTATPEQLYAMLQIDQSIIPLNWFKIMSELASHNNCDIITVQSQPDAVGNRYVIFRKFYENVN